MAFDIYGNDLRRGYCEVHPHVQEEYPCSLCYAEQQQRDHQRRMNNSRALTNEQVEDLCRRAYAAGYNDKSTNLPPQEENWIQNNLQ